MRRCPVCEKEHTHGFFCGSCGFDFSCDYERNRTLCLSLPERAEPVSVRAARLRQRGNETGTAKKSLPVPGQNELTAIICVHCGLVNPDTNFVCDHCAKRLWRYSYQALFE